MTGRLRIIVVIFTLMFSSQAYSQDDPFEPINRVVFKFNDVLDQIAIKPAAKAYQAITPAFVEKRVSNFFVNLDGITSIVNSFAQLKFKKGLKHTGQFTINSTFGIFGLFDVASRFGLDEDSEDFGQTLAVWNIPRGPYLVLPIYGPSSFRGLTGLVTDQFTYPLTYYPKNNEQLIALYGLDLLSTRVELLKYESLLSGDKYEMMRDLYLQTREFDILDGEIVDEFSKDFGEGEFLDETF